MHSVHRKKILLRDRWQFTYGWRKEHGGWYGCCVNGQKLINARMRTLFCYFPHSAKDLVNRWRCDVCSCTSGMLHNDRVSCTECSVPMALLFLDRNVREMWNTIAMAQGAQGAQLNEARTTHSIFRNNVIFRLWCNNNSSPSIPIIAREIFATDGFHFQQVHKSYRIFSTLIKWLRKFSVRAHL